ncbi:hypothetical protein T484DRAFT_1837786 [Baffinella frigidus]|nr:hypothetical protein T484DRAFT_1837786 [Cryptophyta sp. CCMP2293]
MINIDEGPPANDTSQPLSKERLYNLGVAKKRAGDIKTAVDLFKESLKLDPSFVPALMGLGSIWIAPGATHNRSGGEDLLGKLKRLALDKRLGGAGVASHNAAILLH